MTQTQITTVIFDLDGTLLDGIGLFTAGYVHVAELYGLPTPTPAEIKAELSIATSFPEMLKKFFPSVDQQELMKNYLAFSIPRRDQIAQFSGLFEILETLKAKGLMLAIVTGGNATAMHSLRHHKIDHYFTSFVHCDRVNRSKPDPEGVLLALEECGAQPKEAIMIGDSPTDIFAGKNAGLAATVGITHGYGSPESLEAADADHIVHSLAELTDVVLRLVNEYNGV